jgi:hypothetical protein
MMSVSPALNGSGSSDLRLWDVYRAGRRGRNPFHQSLTAACLAKHWFRAECQLASGSNPRSGKSTVKHI